MQPVAGLLLKKEFPSLNENTGGGKSHDITYLRGDEESKLSLLQAQLLSVSLLEMHRSYFTPMAASTLQDALMHPGQGFFLLFTFFPLSDFTVHYKKTC